ncbi:MAG TPA: hypothetical protein VEH30_08685 [Terriglobales bacterium]|nr:hypothetical protein [Terriglobales bacterium]
MMYNPRESGLILRTGLSALKERCDNGPAWPRVLIVVVICSLTLSVTTRFSNVISSPTHTAKMVDGRSVEPKRQHLNRDAIRWLPPVVSSTVLVCVRLHPPIEPTGPSLPKDTFYETLYNRPPPSAISL